jgi:hypothetical protein
MRNSCIVGSWWTGGSEEWHPTSMPVVFLDGNEDFGSSELKHPTSVPVVSEPNEDVALSIVYVNLMRFRVQFVFGLTYMLLLIEVSHSLTLFQQGLVRLKPIYTNKHEDFYCESRIHILVFIQSIESLYL